MNRNLIRKPVFTEKARNKAASGIYTFEVERNATKREIKNILGSLFNVDVEKVRTWTQKPKKRRVGKKRYEVETKSFKMAEVILKNDQKIDLWETPKNEKPKVRKKEKEVKKEK